MKAKVTYESCTISVLGMDLTCPLCGVEVKSGQSHQCESPRVAKEPKRKAVGK